MREWWSEQMWEAMCKRLTHHGLQFHLCSVKRYFPSALTVLPWWLSFLSPAHPTGLKVVLGVHQKVPVVARARHRILGTRSPAKHHWTADSQRILTGHCAVGSAVTVSSDNCLIIRVPREGLNWKPLLTAESDADCCNPAEQEQEHSQQD